jgi:DNA-binding NarL/FixJ family response regulator
MTKEIKFFIVEDDSVFINLLSDIISSISKEYEKEGIVLSKRTFYSVKEAEFELSQNPDIVLLDYYLTDDELRPQTADGLLKAIVEHDDKIKVIIVSGEDDPEIVDDLKLKGAAFYISKSPKSLMRIVPVLKSVVNKIIAEKFDIQIS